MAEGADTDPRRVSIYAVISAETGVDGNHAGKAYHDLVQTSLKSTLLA